MLSFVGFVSCTLVLSTTLGAAKPLALGRADDGGRVLCTSAAVDEDLHRRILIRDESFADEDFDNEGLTLDRALDEDVEEEEEAEDDDDEDDGVFEDGEVFKDVGEDRTDLEWKKIGRYIKRQLKVPKRYLKKIVRTLSKVTKLRSIDGGERMISIMSPHEADGLHGAAAGGANGDFERGDLLFVEEPPSVRYLAVIAAPGKQFYK